MCVCVCAYAGVVSGDAAHNAKHGAVWGDSATQSPLGSVSGQQQSDQSHQPICITATLHCRSTTASLSLLLLSRMTWPTHSIDDKPVVITSAGRSQRLRDFGSWFPDFSRRNEVVLDLRCKVPKSLNYTSGSSWCDCVRVCACPCAKRETNWAINAKHGRHIANCSCLACIHPGVKRSKVKVTQQMHCWRGYAGRYHDCLHFYIS